MPTKIYGFYNSKDEFSESDGLAIDEHGKFLNREQAWVVAKNAGQIIKELTGSYTKPGHLYVEHLFS